LRCAISTGSPDDEHVQSSEPILLQKAATETQEAADAATAAIRLASFDAGYRLLWIYIAGTNNECTSLQQQQPQPQQTEHEMMATSAQSKTSPSSSAERFGRLWMRKLNLLTGRKDTLEEEDGDYTSGGNYDTIIDYKDHQKYSKNSKNSSSSQDKNN